MLLWPVKGIGLKAGFTSKGMAGEIWVEGGGGRVGALCFAIAFSNTAAKPIPGPLVASLSDTFSSHISRKMSVAKPLSRKPSSGRVAHISFIIM